MPRSSATVLHIEKCTDLGNSLALGLKHGVHSQGWFRTGTARNAVPVKFFTTGTAFRLRFCRFATAYSFIFDGLIIFNFF